jgi:hypothetical protein
MNHYDRDALVAQAERTRLQQLFLSDVKVLCGRTRNPPCFAGDF